MPRQFTRWAIRKLEVEEWLVSVVMTFCEETWTVVRTKEGGQKAV